MKDITEQRCSRENCNCDIAGSSPSPFCSDICRTQADSGGRCQCGHPACGGVEGSYASDVLKQRDGLSVVVPH